MSLEPIELNGVDLSAYRGVSYCRFCGAELWWGETENHKRNPFDVRDGKPTAVSHWSTCPKRAEARKAYPR